MPGDVSPACHSCPAPLLVPLQLLSAIFAGLIGTALMVIGIASMAAACDAQALHSLHRSSTLMLMDLRPFSSVAGHGVCRQEIDLRLGAAFSRFQTLTLAKGCEELSNKVGVIRTQSFIWQPWFIFIRLPRCHLPLRTLARVT